MIVKDSQGYSFKKVRLYLFRFLAIVFLTYLSYLVVQYYISESQKEFLYFCDAEKREGDFFEGQGTLFGNAKTQTDEQSYSGNHSCKLNSDHKYGMVLELKNVKPYQSYRARIKHKGNRNNIYLACNANEEANLYYHSKVASKILEDGWSEVELVVTLPENKELRSIKFFPYNAKSDKTEFYDDLRVELLEDRNASFNPHDMAHLYIDNKGMSKLNEIRDEALNRGILLTTNDSWVKAKFSFGDTLSCEVKTRLKGDWTEHLMTDLWSFRVKMPKDQSWNGMMEFSLHNPEARYYLSEWVFHEWLKKEDILTTKYDFVKFKVNNQPETLYAYEEHFLKQIPESNNRREGVIIKFNEDAHWVRRANANDYNQVRPEYDNEERVLANIDAFKESKTLQSPVLLEQFEKAHELLYQLQHGIRPIEEIFDIERTAKYHAICDLLDANHSRIWHNQRFYYNPITQKLEPIGFDGFTENGGIIYNNKPYLGSFMHNLNGTLWEEYYARLFTNSTFAYDYAKYLHKFSNPKYIQEFIGSISAGLTKREVQIQSIFPQYKYNFSNLTEKANTIMLELKALENHSIKAYTKHCSLDSCIVSISNAFRLPIMITGSGSKNVLTSKQAKFMIPSPPTKIPSYQEITVAKSDQVIYWKVHGLEETFTSQIKPFNAPGNSNIAYNQSKTLQIPLNKDQYNIHNNTLMIKPGSYTIDKPLIVSKDLSLSISSGTELTLENDAYILSFGTVNLLGNEEQPIRIKSNSENQGFIVIQAPEKSAIEHVIFEGLDRLEENEWQLTGAVTMYESEVEMKNVVITNNSCEDALNLIRSEFKIDKIHINHTFADGFDADFCQGVIKNSRLNKTGNDALDFSGSIIKIYDCHLTNIGDKGISGGEASTLQIKNLQVDGADIGIASKDKSVITGSKIRLSNCKKAISAYQKKPEYGGGIIDISDLTEVNNEHSILMDSGSQITIDGKKQ